MIDLMMDGITLHVQAGASSLAYQGVACMLPMPALTDHQRQLTSNG